MAANWRNRIVGLEYHVAGEILDHPYQWRTHPDKQLKVLKDVLDEVGIAGAMLIYKSDRENGALVRIDGHGRKKLDPNVTWPCIVLDVNDAEADMILATFDPIGAQAGRDARRLEELVNNVHPESEAVTNLLKDLRAGLAGNSENFYTRKIESPIYEPQGEKPPVSALYDDSVTRKLVAEIEAADFLTDDEKRFLTIAAQRHTVLNFRSIADYYAHSGEDVQNLMENSALVIIDFDKAVDLGFVNLTHKIAAQVKDEYDV